MIALNQRLSVFICALFFIIFSWVPVIFANQLNSESQYSSAQKLYNEINNLKWHYNNLPKYDEVITKCEAIIQENPNTEITLKAQKLIIQCYDKQARYNKQGFAYNKYLKTLFSIYGLDKVAEELIKTADVHFNRSQFFEAKQYYIKLIKIFSHSPKIAYAYYKIAECYKKMGAYDKAIINYNKVLASHQIKEELVKKVCFGLVDSFRVERKYSQAIQSLNIFLKRFPRSKSVTSVKFYLGYFYYQNSNRPEAKKTFGKLLKDYPSSIYANLAKGFLRSLSDSSR